MSITLYFQGLNLNQNPIKFNFNRLKNEIDNVANGIGTYSLYIYSNEDIKYQLFNRGNYNAITETNISNKIVEVLNNNINETTTFRFVLTDYEKIFNFDTTFTIVKFFYVNYFNINQQNSVTLNIDQKTIVTRDNYYWVVVNPKYENKFVNYFKLILEKHHKNLETIMNSGFNNTDANLKDTIVRYILNNTNKSDIWSSEYGLVIILIKIFFNIDILNMNTFKNDAVTAMVLNDSFRTLKNLESYFVKYTETQDNNFKRVLNISLLKLFINFSDEEFIRIRARERKRIKRKAERIRDRAFEKSLKLDNIDDEIEVFCFNISLKRKYLNSFDGINDNEKLYLRGYYNFYNQDKIFQIENFNFSNEEINTKDVKFSRFFSSDLTSSNNVLQEIFNNNPSSEKKPIYKTENSLLLYPKWNLLTSITRYYQINFLAGYEELFQSYNLITQNYSKIKYIKIDYNLNFSNKSIYWNFNNLDAEMINFLRYDGFNLTITQQINVEYIFRNNTFIIDNITEGLAGIYEFIITYYRNTNTGKQQNVAFAAANQQITKKIFVLVNKETVCKKCGKKYNYIENKFGECKYHAKHAELYQRLLTQNFINYFNIYDILKNNSSELIYFVNNQPNIEIKKPFRNIHDILENYPLFFLIDLIKNVTLPNNDYQKIYLDKVKNRLVEILLNKDKYEKTLKHLKLNGKLILEYQPNFYQYLTINHIDKLNKDILYNNINEEDIVYGNNYYGKNNKQFLDDNQTKIDISLNNEPINANQNLAMGYNSKYHLDCGLPLKDSYCIIDRHSDVTILPTLNNVFDLIPIKGAQSVLFPSINDQLWDKIMEDFNKKNYVEVFRNEILYNSWLGYFIDGNIHDNLFNIQILNIEEAHNLPSIYSLNRKMIFNQKMQIINKRFLRSFQLLPEAIKDSIITPYKNNYFKYQLKDKNIIYRDIIDTIQPIPQLPRPPYIPQIPGGGGQVPPGGGGGGGGGGQVPPGGGGGGGGGGQPGGQPGGGGGGVPPGGGVQPGGGGGGGVQPGQPTTIRLTNVQTQNLSASRNKLLREIKEYIDIEEANKSKGNFNINKNYFSKFELEYSTLKIHISLLQNMIINSNYELEESVYNSMVDNFQKLNELFDDYKANVEALSNYYSSYYKTRDIQNINNIFFLIDLLNLLYTFKIKSEIAPNSTTFMITYLDVESRLNSTLKIAKSINNFFAKMYVKKVTTLKKEYVDILTDITLIFDDKERDKILNREYIISDNRDEFEKIEDEFLNIIKNNQPMFWHFYNYILSLYKNINLDESKLKAIQSSNLDINKNASLFKDIIKELKQNKKTINENLYNSLKEIYDLKKNIQKNYKLKDLFLILEKDIFNLVKDDQKKLVIILLYKKSTLSDNFENVRLDLELNSHDTTPNSLNNLKNSLNLKYEEIQIKIQNYYENLYLLKTGDKLPEYYNQIK